MSSPALPKAAFDQALDWEYQPYRLMQSSVASFKALAEDFNQAMNEAGLLRDLYIQPGLLPSLCIRSMRRGFTSIDMDIHVEVKNDRYLMTHNSDPEGENDFGDEAVLEKEYFISEDGVQALNMKMTEIVLNSLTSQEMHAYVQFRDRKIGQLALDL